MALGGSREEREFELADTPQAAPAAKGLPEAVIGHRVHMLMLRAQGAAGYSLPGIAGQPVGPHGEAMHGLSSDTTDLLDRYVAAWNEADPERRRAAVGRLYSERALVVTPTLEVNGAEAILEHIGEVFAEYVAPGDHRFRCTASTGHHRSIVLHWELAVERQPVAGSGLNILFIGPDGRIEADHQFSELDPILEAGGVAR